MATRRRLACMCVSAFAMALGLGTASTTSSDAASAPTLAQLVGQRMVVGMSGTSPSRSLLQRVRAGKVGGVILFSSNIRGAAQVTKLTSELQAAARAGGQPPLLIATDQEGGLVRRFPWAPPKRSAEELGTTSVATIGSIGEKTGAALRQAGVNLNFAPVVDVPRSSANFIGAQHRAFASNRYAVANDAVAFSKGLERGGVMPALKHFPGLGRAGATSTDNAVVRIQATASQIRFDLLPYSVALGRAVHPMIMLSTAIYPALARRAAAWSPKIAGTLLRGELGFRGVTITDSLTSAASARGVGPGLLAARSAAVGIDLILVTGEAQAEKAYQAVLAKAQSGAIPLADLRASYNRILRLKGRI